jgi:predicted membrane-bound spermidine synthase
MDMKIKYFYFLSFVEGGAVMTAELVGAKLLAPFFGTSLYVWAATLGVTLGGLMSGYYVGGRASVKFEDSNRTVHLVVLIGCLSLLVMPWISPWVMNLCMGLSLQAGAVLSLLVFLFPTLFFMGMVSPLLIKILTDEKEKAGNNAGNIYAISTLGGILFTFFMGFYFIPEYGLWLPAVLTSLAMLAFPLFWFFNSKKTRTAILFLMFFVLMSFLSYGFKMEEEKYKIIYKRESLLGQIKVVEINNNENGSLRALLVNNTMQTVENLDNPDYSYWQYTDYIIQLLEDHAPSSKGLLLGVGGGTILKRLLSKGMNVDAVEIDPYVAKVAYDYFMLPKEKEIHIQDARYYMRKSPQKSYDYIIIDVLKGESAPEHLLTVESINHSLTLLKDNGQILINFYGYTDGKIGLAFRSLIKTIKECGISPQVFITDGEPDSRNMVIQIHKGIKNPINSSYFNIIEIPDVEDAYILRDLSPKPHIFLLPALRWRHLNNQWYFKN